MKLTPAQIEARESEMNLVLAMPSAPPGKHSPGRIPDGVVLPDSIKDIVGAVALIEGPKAAADAFGITPPAAAHHRNRVGAKSTEQDLRNIAMDRALKAFNLITDEKLEECKPMQLAQIAKLAADVALKNAQEETRDAKVIVYAPQTQNNFTKMEIVDNA